VPPLRAAGVADPAAAAEKAALASAARPTAARAAARSLEAACMLLEIDTGSRRNESGTA
jgi:hypothetical protein